MAHRKAKKNSDRSRREPARSGVSGTLARQLEHIEDLVDAKKLMEARRELIALCQRYPNRPEPLSWLVHVCQALEDHGELQHACERLLRLEPRDRDVTLLLAGSSLASGRAATARRVFQRFLAQWPDDPVAEKVREELRGIEGHIRTYLECYGLPDEQMWELADQHELVQTLIARHQPQRAREAAEKLLAWQPDFVPGWNNLSLALFYLGDVAGAVAASRRVLETEPENYQALSNLIRCLALSDRREEALELVARLKAAQSDNVDLFVKKAEALSILSDDEGLLKLFAEAESSRPLHLSQDASLLHYAATAAARLGDETRADELWRRALKLDPGLQTARENLDDLAEPPEQREGPWSFSLPNLCPQAWLERLRPRQGRAGREAFRGQLRRALEQNPQIIAAAPAALEVGDPLTRDLFIGLAADTGASQLLESLKTFALGQRGSYGSRTRALQFLNRKGLLPPGPVRMWHNGQWREIEMLSFEISGEARTAHSPDVTRLADEARAAMNRGEFEASERLWRQALELEPDKPDLLNNLATAIRQQGQKDEANALLDDLLRQHPDYLFARVNGAHRLVDEGKFEEAHELLKPLQKRGHLHLSEFFALAGAWINVLVSQGKPEGARPWMAMWEQIAPEDPQLRYWRIRVPSGRGAKSLRPA